VRRGTWTVPWRGWICPCPEAATTEDEEHALRAAAAALSRPGTVDSHASGALLHSQPVRPACSGPGAVDGALGEPPTRLCLIDAGLDAPLTLQAPIATDRGTYWVDLLLREHRVVIEADGQAKYDSPGVLWREKVRQDAIQRAGYAIVRATWDDVTDRPTERANRVRRACARATLGTF